MNLNELNSRKLKYAKQFHTSIFPDSEIYEFVLENGIYGQHYPSEGDENLIMAPTLGRHTHDSRLGLFFASMGFNTTVFHYSGTYESWNAGKFLPKLKKNKKMSIQQDLSDIIDSLHPEEEISLFGPCFGGAPVVAEASSRTEQVDSVFLFAPMLYGSETEPYKDEKDKSQKLGYKLSLKKEDLPNREYGPYNETASEKWFRKIWIPMIKGKSSLNYQKHLHQLAESKVKIYGMAAQEDNLISSNTLAGFARDYFSIPGSNDESFFYLIEDKPAKPDEEHHYGHYFIEYAPGAVETFFQFLKKDSLLGIIKKKQIDIEFTENARGIIPDPLLDAIYHHATKSYVEDKSDLVELPMFKEKRREFIPGTIVFGWIL